MNRRNFRISASAIVLILGLGVLALGLPAQTQPARLNGDCSNASKTSFLTLFMFDNSLDNPVPGINVTAGGISQVTNSSGFAVIAGGNFVNFTISYYHEVFVESLSGYQSPLICSGSSYYRVVGLTVSEGSQVPVDGEVA